MPPARRFQAPAGNGDVLAEPAFDTLPAQVEANRRRLDRADVMISGLPLRELRALARQEVLELASGGRQPPDSSKRGADAPRSPDAPLLLAGHQPELSHPGVWVKHFALNGLARKVGGVPLNLIVDNDTLKSVSLRFPSYSATEPEAWLESVPFDRLDGEAPYEDRRILDPACFRSFAERSKPIWQKWNYVPLLPEVWRTLLEREPTNISAAFAGLRQEYERRWGCVNRELPVSCLSRISAFRRFAAHILADLPRFREVYNAAIRAYRTANRVRSDNHPAPELLEGEAPFWVHSSEARRKRATPASDPATLRPRALTLTLFARVCLGDFFIHGIGGGKYDEVTDTIIRDYFGIEPPAFQVLSATLHLPLPGFPATDADVKRAEHLLRDLTWNPQRHLTPTDRDRPEVQKLIAEKATLAAAEPPYPDHAARRDWFRRLHQVTEQLRAFVADPMTATESKLTRLRAEAHANAILRRRDYSWVLYPEDTLRPFLQRFLAL